MLTESFIASTFGSGKIPSQTSLPKDAGIFLQDFQPMSTLKGYFNKSSTERNCLAVTNSHVFAAQSDGALVRVFNREKGNLETFVPFNEQISCLAVIGPNDGAPVLILGTGQGKTGKDGFGGGRIMLWELCSGRLVQLPASHVQSVTCLAVDPTNNFLLSGSSDSQIHVWSLPALLSFTELDEAEHHLRSSPVRTLINHEGGITALVTGHSRMPFDIAISASEDKRCNVWDYRSGTLLHTFLMGQTPLCLAIDPADRGFYAGLESGAVQLVNFHKEQHGIHPLYSKTSASTSTEALESDQWSVEGVNKSPVTSLDVSYDSTMILAGYESGAIYAWDVGEPRNPALVANFARPVTNLTMLPPTGFPTERTIKSQLNESGTRILSVVKPQPTAGVAKSGAAGLYVPDNYTFTACFDESLPPQRFCDEDGNDTLFAEFEKITTPGNPNLPEDLWERALAELSTRRTGFKAGGSKQDTHDDKEPPNNDSYEIERLKMQLSIAHKQQKAMVAKLSELQTHNQEETEQGRGRRKKT